MGRAAPLKSFEVPASQLPGQLFPHLTFLLDSCQALRGWRDGWRPRAGGMFCFIQFISLVFFSCIYTWLNSFSNGPVKRTSLFYLFPRVHFSAPEASAGTSFCVSFRGDLGMYKQKYTNINVKIFLNVPVGGPCLVFCTHLPFYPEQYSLKKSLELVTPVQA